MVRATWPSLRFYTPLNISGITEARVVKFWVVVVYIKCWPSDNYNRPWRGRGQGHESNFKILHALKYLWNYWSWSRQILRNCRLYQVWACGQLTVSERTVVRVTRPSFEFYTPWNIFGTAKATDFKFCARFGQRSTNLQMTNCPLSWRGQGHVTILEFHTPWNISGTAEARIVKFCALAGYVKF